MIVVSNTSPMINLFVIGHLDLLRQLYERIYVPTSVMDERMGRQQALQHELTSIGLLGILVACKTNGLLPLLKPLLDDLRTRAGFWLSENLYREVLAAVDE
jgi:predicted nucleic acid-binding protein